jgi:putative peptidoglycan lipid II flippase
LTALSLKAFAVGLIGFSFVKILSPAYFAREDTKTPVKIGLICLLLNLVLGASLAFYLSWINFPGPHAGLALAISIAALLNALLLFIGLKKEGIIDQKSKWRNFIIQIFFANTLMILCLIYAEMPLSWWLSIELIDRIMWLLLTIVTSMFVYFCALFLAGIKLDILKFKK